LLERRLDAFDHTALAEPCAEQWPVTPAVDEQAIADVRLGDLVGDHGGGDATRRSRWS
jgi:hypothetical protein